MDLVDNVLDRLIDLPEDAQIDALDALRNASIILDNWSEMRDSLTSRAIDREFYELCAILRDI
jgi:hypothetical protein